jgi:hypothetical protein
MIDRVSSAVVAVFLALLIWVSTRSREQEVLDHVPVPVDISLSSSQSDQYNLEVVGQAQVLATFTGPPSRIRELRGLLQRDQLRVEQTFSVPADRFKENRFHETLIVETADIHTPPGITTALVTGRNQVRVILHRLGEKQLPVRFDHTSETQGSVVTIDPPSVLVRGPLEVLENVNSIPTQSGVLGSARRASVPLIRELDGRPIQCEPPTVLVRVNAPAQKRTYELNDVPVHFLTPASFPFRPRFANDRAGTVKLRVRGPAQDEVPRVQAFVDLTARGIADPTGRGVLRSRWYDEQVQIHVPRGFQLMEGPPLSVTFELVPIEEQPPRIEP